MHDDFEIDIIDEEENKDFVPLLKPTIKHTTNYKVSSRYVSRVLVNYVLLYTLVVLVVMNFLSTIIKIPVSHIAELIKVDTNLINAVISAILLVLFNLISLLISIKINSNYKKNIPINVNFIHFRLMFFGITLPILTSVISVINFYLYVKDVTDYYKTSFLLLNFLVFALNTLLIFSISKKLKKII